jgi:hypothetical protein
MNSPALFHSLGRRPPFTSPAPPSSSTEDRPWAEGREKFFSPKIHRNPLKSLDSDEGIQGNPSFSNPQKRGFRGEKV